MTGEMGDLGNAAMNFVRASPKWYAAWQDTNISLGEFCGLNACELALEMSRSRFSVNIDNYGLGVIDFAMVEAIVETCKKHKEIYEVIIHTSDFRKPDGFLMYQFSIQYTRESKPVYMGCVQRSFGGEYEFHS